MILIQSLVQIILESLPISSSGHLVLLQAVTGWPMMSKSFEYLLHGPTIILLMVYFRSTWVPLLMHCWRYRCLIARMIFLGCSADIVTALVYGCMQWFAPLFPLWLGFAITACMLVSLRWAPQSQRGQMSVTKATSIGFMQGIAGLPGISRLATTYTAGIWLGLAPHKSFYFSCMIQFPLICAGFLYGVYATRETADIVLLLQPYYIVVLLGATVVAYYLLLWVQRCMQEGTLWKFAYYMVLPICLAFLV